MRYLIPILFVFALGCDNSDDTKLRSTRPESEAAASTQPNLKPIEMHFGIYLARLDHRLTVSSDGLLRSVRIDNKSYGGNDIDPKNERIEVREGRLTEEQMSSLSLLFADWESLSSKPYANVPDGGEVSIRYGERTVSGGSGVPKQITDIRLRLTELARQMPVVNP